MHYHRGEFFSYYLHHFPPTHLIKVIFFHFLTVNLILHANFFKAKAKCFINPAGVYKYIESVYTTNVVAAKDVLEV